ncbi:MAG: glycosyltransferase [Burkholderiaceae bacterium]
MRSFLVTGPQAGKLPRWGLLLLCLLYVVPGFIGRDPWRPDDAAGFGIAVTMLGGSLQDWLAPNVYGASLIDEGPLPYALAALTARLGAWLTPWLQAVHPALVPGAHLAVRLTAMAGILTTLAFVWHATFRLARRPGIAPSDPFGAGASPTDFARAIADSALLIVLATFGLIARLHETAGHAAMVCWVAMLLYGMALALERPQRGGFIAGLAVGAGLATQGIAVALALLVPIVVLPRVSHPYGLVTRPLLRMALPTALLASLSWPAAVIVLGDESTLLHLSDWLQWNLQSIGLPGRESLSYWVRYLPWFYWPAWPLAAWALWRWRGQFNLPALALPISAGLPLLLLAPLASQPGEQWLLPATMPFALLAAVGLPTLKRAVVSLIDWFAVSLFSLFGFAIWAYWLAYLSGWPPRMAYSVSQLNPGYLAEWSALDLGLALIASAAWIMLVQWRISRRPPMIWRALVLSSGGLCLAWFLLMTIWLPVFNERNTYRGIAHALAMQIGDRSGCVQTRSLGLAERASLGYFGRIRFARPDEIASDQRCPHLLIQDHGPVAQADPPPEEPGWTLIWKGQRRPNNDERFRLYRSAGMRRSDATPAAGGKNVIRSAMGPPAAPRSADDPVRR